MARNKRNMGLIRRFAPYFKKYKWVLVLDLFCASLTTVCELVLPLIVQYITDMGMNNLEALTVQIILQLGLFYLVLRLIDGAANYYMASIGHVMGARIETDMRRDLFDHLQKLSFSYYDNTKIGQIMARITSDLFDVTEFAHHCPEEFFIAGVKIVASFCILCPMNLWLTLIIFAILPLMVACSLYFNRKMRVEFKRSRVQIGELNAQVEDSLLGVRVVKSFANEDIERAKFDDGNQHFLSIKKAMYRYMAGRIDVHRGGGSRCAVHGEPPAGPRPADGLSAVCLYPADFYPPHCGIHRAVPARYDGYRALCGDYGRTH